MKRDISLDGYWRLAAYEVGLGERQGAHRAHYDTSGWLDASVPGSIRSHLLEAGLVSETLTGKEWWYRTEFTLLPGFPLEHSLLVFDRLPSATVWVNGTKLPSDDSCSYDVRSLLKLGPNTIAIRFDADPGFDGLFLGSAHIVARKVSSVGC